MNLIGKLGAYCSDSARSDQAHNEGGGDGYNTERREAADLLRVQLSRSGSSRNIWGWEVEEVR